MPLPLIGRSTLATGLGSLPLRMPHHAQTETLPHHGDYQLLTWPYRSAGSVIPVLLRQPHAVSKVAAVLLCLEALDLRPQHPQHRYGWHPLSCGW